MSSLGMSIYSLSVAALVTGVLSVLNTGEASGTGKFIKFAISLAVLAAMLAPMSSLKNMLFEGEGSEIKQTAEDLRQKLTEIADKSRESIAELSIAEAEKKTAELAAAKFGVPAEDITVELVTYETEGGIAVSSATVRLGLRAYLLEPDEVEEYISGLCGCECRVIFR